MFQFKDHAASIAVELIKIRVPLGNLDSLRRCLILNALREARAALKDYDCYIISVLLCIHCMMAPGMYT